LVLEVGEGGVELGFEGRRVGVEDGKVREVVAEKTLNRERGKTNFLFVYLKRNKRSKENGTKQ